LGQGSEFVVRLPALTSAAFQPENPAPQASGEGVPLRILVVDDNIDAADCLGQLLGGWGHTVQIVNDGITALEAEAAFGPNAVMLDLGLPRLGGLEVARRLRQKHQHHPLLLVAMTGFGQDEDRVRSAEAGFNYHFTKPIDLDVLRSLLVQWSDVCQKPAMRSSQRENKSSYLQSGGHPM
jgi:CheY-like chemotaxis protein